MNSTTNLRFLRPYVSKDVSATRKSIYVRFFNTTRYLAQPNPNIPKVSKGHRNATAPRKKQIPKTADLGKDRAPIESRIKELEEAHTLNYPRIQCMPNTLTVTEYQRRYGSMTAGEKRHLEIVTVNGRVKNMRIAGKALIFIDIEQDGHALQVVCQADKLGAFTGVPPIEFRRFYHLVRRGDIISITGTPYASQTAEISISAEELPTILSPCLPNVPYKIEDPETRIRNRHVDLLVNRRSADIIRLRSHIIEYVRDFLLKDSFLEVQTPIIADVAGGAIARPFTTVATEFSDRQLALRIAPEIWLKRLILGGMDRVFEIGPAFRNEGLDATHNPEFTTCEFYKSFADLEELISMTEKLLSGLAKRATELRSYPLKELPKIDNEEFATPFKRVEFIPALQESLRETLPDLGVEGAQDKLLALFTKHKITPPSSPTLPRLLDKLSSVYIEPDCIAPTFIMHHPACLAPLSKSFVDPKTKQLVSARVELFVQNREIANMYEEENSPFEQRRKFVEQAKWRDDENKTVIDESYLEALEWGLPPTGGWGCGIDRLCMLFSGASRISDVLPFGSLKNVVNLGREGSGEEDKKGDM